MPKAPGGSSSRVEKHPADLLRVGKKHPADHLRAGSDLHNELQNVSPDDLLDELQ